MDPNKGHGENIRTYNWREKGRRSIGRSRIAASRRLSKRGTERLSFSAYGGRIRAGRRPGGPTNQRVEIPSEQNRHRPRNLSSTAKQNDKIPQGNIYRGVGG